MSRKKENAGLTREEASRIRPIVKEEYSVCRACVISDCTGCEFPGARKELAELQNELIELEEDRAGVK